MKKFMALALCSVVAFGLPLGASGQATLAFNNLDQNARVVRIALGPTGGGSILLNQDLNFTLEAGPVGGMPQTLHVWLLSDGSAKGINVAPGRFKDPSDGVYAVPGVAPGGPVEVQIMAWPGHSETPVRGHESSQIRFVMTGGGAGAAPSGMRNPDFTVYNVPVPYHLATLGLVRSNGLSQLSLTGRVGYGYALEYTSTLPTEPTNAWRSLMNQTNWVFTNSAQFFTDTSAAGMAQRFYRVGPYPIPPPPSLVWINPGNFLMGSPTNEAARSPNQSPETQVTLTHGFWIGQYKVKQIEYQSMVNINPSWFIGDPDLPVESLTWYDATNYCAQLTEHERLAGRLPAGYAYRLPSHGAGQFAAFGQLDGQRRSRLFALARVPTR